MDKKITGAVWVACSAIVLGVGYLLRNAIEADPFINGLVRFIAIILIAIIAIIILTALVTWFAAWFPGRIDRIIKAWRGLRRTIKRRKPRPPRGHQAATVVPPQKKSSSP